MRSLNISRYLKNDDDDHEFTHLRKEVGLEEVAFGDLA